MINDMKNCARSCLITALCLSALSVQAVFGAPERTRAFDAEYSETISTEASGPALLPGLPADTYRFANPLDLAHAIAHQIRDAAEQAEKERARQEQQMEKFGRMMETLQDALNIRAGDAADREDGTDSSETVHPFSQTDIFGGGDRNDGALPETEAVEETETETETELPEETETEFHPAQMGASLPDTGEPLHETQSGTDAQDAAAETETVETPPTEEGSGETDDSVMVSRHGTFAVPLIRGLNEARINLYDYRMLREFPLSRLPKDLHSLHRRLSEQVSGYDGTWSVYVQNLTTGQALVVNDTSMRSASVMKLFIMETVYEAFDRGDLPRNEDTVYLLRNMIINSSNDSSNRLLALLGDGDIAAGIDRVNELIRLRGFSEGTVCYNGFEDPAASINPDSPNIITAKDVGLLLSRIYNRAFISRNVCNEIEQMMLDQATRYKIPRGLPEGVACGNKSGETDTIANDAAVVYGPTTDYLLIVLSNDWSNEDTANSQIAEVSKTVYGFFEN